MSPKKKPPWGGFFFGLKTPENRRLAHHQLLLGCFGSGFGGFCSLVCFHLGSVSGGCSAVSGGTGFFGCVHGGRRSGWLDRHNNGLDRNNDGRSWLNRRHGHFFLLAASGQSESGEQGSEQNGFFHDDFSNE
jgi:hypothetical protein